MEMTIQCPNCLQQVPNTDDYCMYCGVKLNKAASWGKPKEPVSVKKYCPNGHGFDDPELVFCPVCGLPFDEAVRRKRTPEHESLPEPEPIRGRHVRTEPSYPEGMHAPTNNDLLCKRKSSR